MAKEPTAEQLELFCKLQTERKQLESKARSIKAKEDQLADLFFAWLKSKSKAMASRLGYVLTIVPGSRYPKWKDEFIKQLGNEAAEKVVNETEPSESLIIVPPQPTS